MENEMKDHDNVKIFDHPLISHKIAFLRDRNTGTKEFRELVEEITMLMTYEAFKDAPTREITVETPLEKCVQRIVSERKIAIVPILRAGLGMVSGVQKIFPLAKVGHIGLQRNEETKKPEAYYSKLPEGIADMQVTLLDPMLATGGSANAAIEHLRAHGVKSIKLMSVIGSPEGVEKVAEKNPDVKIYLAALDRGLNADCYILPGLGDAGDRLFGTK